ncbi:MAG: hypothetical protein ACQR33_00055 [Candidatus Saccharibacteria bacterium]
MTMSNQPTGLVITPHEMHAILAWAANPKTSEFVPLPLLAVAAMSLVLAGDKRHRPITRVMTLAERFNQA